MNFYGSNYFQILMVGGSSNLNLTASGFFSQSESFVGMGAMGCYWTVPTQPNSVGVLLIAGSGFDVTDFPVGEGPFVNCSVRYIKDTAL